MHWWIIIPTALALIGIVWQDFSQRKFYWWLPVISAIGMAALFIQTSGWDLWLTSIGVNLLVFGIQAMLVGVAVNFMAKRRGVTISSLLGLGDIVFIASLLFAMTPMNLLMHYVVILLVTLLTVIAIQKVKRQSTTIPLAGIMAGALAVLMFAQNLIPNYSWYTNTLWTP